jgi:hypothetical protein
LTFGPGSRCGLLAATFVRSNSSIFSPAIHLLLGSATARSLRRSYGRISVIASAVFRERPFLTTGFPQLHSRSAPYSAATAGLATCTPIVTTRAARERALGRAATDLRDQSRPTLSYRSVGPQIDALLSHAKRQLDVHEHRCWDETT